MEPKVAPRETKGAAKTPKGSQGEQLYIHKLPIHRPSGPLVIIISLSLSIYIYIYTYIAYIYIYTHICIYAYSIYVCIYVCVDICPIYVYVCRHTFLNMDLTASSTPPKHMSFLRS